MRIPEQQNVTPMPPVKPVKVSKYPDIEYLSKCARAVGALIEEEKLKKLLEYESPITFYMSEIQTQIEDNCLKAVQSYGFNVDKDELKKALEYDRDQYNKGYAARERYERPSGEWITDERGYVCSVCGTLHCDDYPFCHMCGACMIKEAKND